MAVYLHEWFNWQHTGLWQFTYTNGLIDNTQDYNSLLARIGFIDNTHAYNSLLARIV